MTKEELIGLGFTKVNYLCDEEDDIENVETDEVDYSRMSKNEIMKLIDDALDKGDFKKVEELHKYV